MLSAEFKVGKKLEINKKDKVFEKLAEIIKKAYTKKDEGEISQILKRGTIKELIGGESFIEGVCYPYKKTICLKPYMIKNIINGNIDLTAKNIGTHTSIHETIHLIRSLQYPYRFFERKVVGFEEGATEYMTFKATERLGKYGSTYLLNNKGQKIKSNIPTTNYNECTSFMAQLAIIFGEDKLQEFAFGENEDLLKDLQNACGKDFYEHLRKTLNKYTTDTPYIHQEALQLQSELLERCYTSRFSQIDTIDDAITLFTELQDINKVRFHFDEDKSFEEFYKKQYEKCIKKFGDDFEKIQSLKYQEPEFLNVTTREEIKNKFNNAARNFIFYTADNLDKSIEKINNSKRYIALHNDTLYQILIFKDKAIDLSIGNEKEGIGPSTATFINDKNSEIYKLRTVPSMTKFDSDFYLKKGTDNSENYTLIIDGEEIQLTEIDLGITREDVTEYYSQQNSFIQEKKFKEKFLDFFSRKNKKLLNEPKNTDENCTKQESEIESFKDSVKVNISTNNDIGSKNEDNLSEHDKTVTIDNTR